MLPVINIKNISLLLFITIIFTACSSKKPALPVSQTNFQVKDFPTTIYHNISEDETKRVELYAPKLRFKAIDGKSYESQFSAGMQMFVTKYHSIVLKAGKHRVKFYYDAYSMPSASLDFKEGHKYLFDFYITSYNSPIVKNIQFWVYDLTDKKVVWGNKDKRVQY